VSLERGKKHPPPKKKPHKKIYIFAEMTLKNTTTHSTYPSKVVY